MQKLSTIPQSTLLAVERLLVQYREYQQLTQELELAAPNSIKKALLKKDRQQVGDEMTFANHIIWLLYKNKAYQNTDQALNTLGDLKSHCAPVDDICHKRFEFLKQYVPEISTIFPDSMPLPTFYQEAKVVTLLTNDEFLERWKDQEFYRNNALVKKWQKI